MALLLVPVGQKTLWPRLANFYLHRFGCWNCFHLYQNSFCLLYIVYHIKLSLYLLKEKEKEAINKKKEKRAKSFIPPEEPVKSSPKGDHTGQLCRRGAGQIGPLPNRPLAIRPPKKVCSGHIGPLKIWPTANRPPVKNFYKYKLSIEFIDLHKAFNWVVEDIFSAS